MTTYKSFYQRYLVKILSGQDIQVPMKNLIVEDFLEPEFVLISPKFTKSIFEKIISMSLDEETPFH